MSLRPAGLKIPGRVHEACVACKKAHEVGWGWGDEVELERVEKETREFDFLNRWSENYIQIEEKRYSLIVLNFFLITFDWDVRWLYCLAVRDIRLSQCLSPLRSINVVGNLTECCKVAWCRLLFYRESLCNSILLDWGHSHMRETGMLVFGPCLGYSGQNAIILSRQGLV